MFLIHIAYDGNRNRLHSEQLHRDAVQKECVALTMEHVNSRENFMIIGQKFQAMSQDVSNIAIVKIVKLNVDQHAHRFQHFRHHIYLVIRKMHVSYRFLMMNAANNGHVQPVGVRQVITRQKRSKIHSRLHITAMLLSSIPYI